MGIVVITAAAVLCAAAVLFIPFTYHVSIRTGRPFRLCVRAGWFGRALHGTWDYTWGQRPVSSVYIGWKRQAGPPPDLSEDTAEKAADQAAEAVRQQTETDSAVTYESLKREGDGKAPKAAGFHWKPLVFNRDFAAAFFCWLGRILHHSRVRSLDIRGVIGLGQPHETGLLAGALYAVVPDAIGGLRFDYLEERYDSTIRGSGTLYPAALLWYSALFIASRPVRRLIAGWHASKRESIMDNTIKNNLETIFNNFREMIKVETVVGQAVQIGGATIIPFVDVTFGFGSGSTDGQGSRAGGGGGAKLEPAAVLVIKGDRVEMFSIKKDGYQASAFEKLIAMAPEIIDKMKKDKYIYIKDEDEEAPAADKEK